MLGTFINIGAVSAGGVLGIAIGSRLPQTVLKTVFDSLGLITVAMGIQMSLKTQNILIVLGSLLVGGIVGEYLNIESMLDSVGFKFQKWFSMKSNRNFVEGFISSSVLFCVGPMAILGALQDGLEDDYTILSIKAILDGFASLGLASALGWGVLFSSISLLFYQGFITISAEYIQNVMTEPMITEMTATGGLLILAIGIRLLGLKNVRVGNLLPSLAIAPVMTWLIPLMHHFLPM